jgi:arsenate reductase (thioredoxin)
VNVLFFCVQNAGGSQMAEALFRRATGAEHQGRSASSSSAAPVRPESVTAMQELDGTPSP